MLGMDIKWVTAVILSVRGSYALIFYLEQWLNCRSGNEAAVPSRLVDRGNDCDTNLNNDRGWIPPCGDTTKTTYKNDSCPLLYMFIISLELSSKRKCHATISSQHGGQGPPHDVCEDTNSTCLSHHVALVSMSPAYAKREQGKTGENSAVAASIHYTCNKCSLGGTSLLLQVDSLAMSA